jgi:protein SCO1
MNRRVWLSGLVILVALIAVTALLFVTRKQSFKGSVITPPWPAADFTLTDHNGQQFTMSSQRGKVVLLYFGFTHCPHECPLTMAHLKLALEQLGDLSKNVQVLMVSTDPARDTPQSLKDFMSSFNPAFLGLMGSPDELQKVWKDYGVSVMDGGETHSVYLYVIDPKGDIRETLGLEVEPKDIASDVRLLLRGK